jgi:chemotaxis protein MotB
VALFTNTGVDPTRLSVAGLGEYRPVADNRDEAGRNHNRRVVVVVGAEQMLSRHPATVDPDETPGALHGTAPSAAATPAAPVASAPEAAPVPALAEGELRLETAAATERPRPRADGQGLTVILPSGTLTRLQEAPPAATPAPGTRSQP